MSSMMQLQITMQKMKQQMRTQQQQQQVLHLVAGAGAGAGRRHQLQQADPAATAVAQPASSRNSSSRKSSSKLRWLLCQRREMTWQQQKQQRRLHHLQQQKQRSQLQCLLQVVALAAGVQAGHPRLHLHHALHVCWQLPNRATWLRLGLALQCSSSRAEQQLRRSRRQQQQQVMVTSAWVRMQATSWSLQRPMQHVQQQQLPAGWQRSHHHLASAELQQMQT
jgi:hypothetical protein